MKKSKSAQKAKGILRKKSKTYLNQLVTHIAKHKLGEGCSLVVQHLSSMGKTQVHPWHPQNKHKHKKR
jgi:hypothetical protein